MPAPPRISVLLPVRDAIATLPEALGSVLSESAPLEVVAVDDGSTDGSGSWLEERVRHEPRLRVVRTDKRGIAAALDRALAAAAAPFVARLDADDRSLPGRLAALLAALEGGADLAGTGVALHPDGLAGPGMRRYVAWLQAVSTESLPREMWIDCPLAHPTWGARRDVLLDAGGWQDGPFPEDYELLLRLAAAGRRLVKIEEVLYWWRDRPGSLTRTDPRYSLAAHRRLKAGRLAAGPLAGARGVALWGAARTGRPFGRALAACGIPVAGWIDVDPRLVGRTLEGAPVLAPDRLEAVGELPIVVAVGAPGARLPIRAALGRAGRREGADFWVVA